jgi:hypothetical protein
MPNNEILIILGKIVIILCYVGFLLFIGYMMIVATGMTMGMIEELRYRFETSNNIRKLKFIMRNKLWLKKILKI